MLRRQVTYLLSFSYCFHELITSVVLVFPFWCIFHSIVCEWIRPCVSGGACVGTCLWGYECGVKPTITFAKLLAWRFQYTGYLRLLVPFLFPFISIQGNLVRVSQDDVAPDYLQFSNLSVVSDWQMVSTSVEWMVHVIYLDVVIIRRCDKQLWIWGEREWSDRHSVTCNIHSE